MKPIIDTSGLSEDAYSSLLEGVIAGNQEFLASSDNFIPKLYESEVKYQLEDPGLEEWRAIPSILEHGVGDCEDLTAWRIAELRNEGVDAQPLFLDNGAGWHAVVEHPDGTIEDPSLVLDENVRAKMDSLKYKVVKDDPNFYVAYTRVNHLTSKGYGETPMLALYDATEKLQSKDSVGSLTALLAGGALDKIVDLAKDEDFRNDVSDMFTYGRGKRRGRRGKRTNKKEKTLLEILKLLLAEKKAENESSGLEDIMESLSVGEMITREQARRRGITPQGRGQSRGQGRGSRRRNIRRQPTSQRSRQYSRIRKIQNNLKTNLGQARKGIANAKRKINSLEAQRRRDVNEVESDIREINIEFQTWAQQVTQFFNEVVEYYNQGYDVLATLQEIQLVYQQAYAMVEDEIISLQDEIDAINSEIEDEIVYFESVIESAADYVETKKEQAKEEIELIKNME